MNEIRVLIMDDGVKAKFDCYPEAARKQLLKVRAIIYEIAKEESLGELIENLKWNEPSYLSKQGSAIRMDWKEKSPSTFSIYVIKLIIGKVVMRYGQNTSE